MECEDFVNHRAKSTLAVALGASLLLHVLVFAPGVAVMPRVAFSQALKVRLVVADAPRRAEQRTVSEPRDVRPAATPGRVETLRVPEPSRNEVRADAGAVGGAVSIEPTRLAPSVEQAPATAVLQASEGEVDGEALRAYRIALAVGARRARVAGEAAAFSGPGTVVVRVVLGGAAPVISSDGDSDLDLEARRLVRRALEVTALPGALRGRPVTLELPITFGGGGRG